MPDGLRIVLTTGGLLWLGWTVGFLCGAAWLSSRRRSHEAEAWDGGVAYGIASERMRNGAIPVSAVEDDEIRWDMAQA